MTDSNTWVTDWAGGVHGLARILADRASDADIRARAADCLALVAARDPTALENIALREEDQHLLAWLCLPSPWSLEVLAKSDGAGLTVSDVGQQRSRLSTLLHHAERLATKRDASSVRDFELILDIIARAPDVEVVSKYLARKLPLLVITSRMRGSTREIDLPPSEARRVVSSLLAAAMAQVDGRSCSGEAVALMPQWSALLDQNGPLRKACDRAMIHVKQGPAANDGGGGGPTQAHTEEERPTGTSVLQTNPAVTAAKLLSTIAPAYYSLLTTASVPPLGIPSIVSPRVSDGPSQASAWAGKVYSQHQFRTREHIGLGIASAPTASRPASKHVDEYLGR